MQARFRRAGLHARRGEHDEALRLLQELKASGSFDVELARDSDDFRALRADPRFESVLFRPEEFLAPFAERVQVLHEWVGESKGDQFGWIARGIGDVDGDGVIDIVTTAPTFGGAGAGLGAGRSTSTPGEVARRSGSAWETRASGLESAWRVRET